MRRKVLRARIDHEYCGEPRYKVGHRLRKTFTLVRNGEVFLGAMIDVKF